MDLQDVANLTMPEGGVKTIHDKDNRLLWGAVGYNTKYTGDTTQNGTPTPDTPVSINVVIGVQTVTVSDGTLSEAFTIDLGATELCKIGGYQDYIYKSGGDWYVHKAIKKVTLNGTESWAYANNAAYSFSITDYAISDNIPVSDYFQGVTNVSGADSVPANSVAFINVSGSTTPRFYIKYPDYFTSAAELKTWLLNHNATVYYALETPTDTQITDAALISQLNAIHEWLTRYGYNATVSGNLPLIIDRTNL